MAFVPPTFNLSVKIWSAGVDPRVNPARLTVNGQLRPPEHTSFAGYATGVSGGYPTMSLLLPKGTDVRDDVNTGAPGDVVECPAGTGRYYMVQYVDDTARGFMNEYRFVWMFKHLTIAWPVPIP